MKKYAMVAICRKIADDTPIVRRVLISYSYKRKSRKEKTMIKYCRSRFLAMDPYFTDKERSHQYMFCDDGYSLVSVTDDYAIPMLNVKRAYHYYETPWVPSYYEPIEFKAKTDQEAIEKFNSRKKDS